jgi:hypothetical protein
MKFQVTIDTAATASKVKDTVTEVKAKVSHSRQDRKAIRLAKEAIKEQTEQHLLVLGTQLLAEQEAEKAKDAVETTGMATA